MWYQPSYTRDAMCHFRESRDVWAEETRDEEESEDSHPALEADRDVEVELLTDGGDDD
jgi:hypothetical protein